MTLSKDRSNSIVVDKGNNLQQLNLKTAGRILRLQTSEQVIPEVDQHRLSVMEAAAVSNSKAFGTSAAASDKTNAYANVLQLTESLSNDKVPLVNRVLWATPSFINFLKQDSTFILNSDLAYKDLVRGQVGEVDGAKVIMTPSAYFADEDDEAVLAHKSVTVAAEQLNKFMVHMDPPGISGMQIDYRIIYDAFVRTPKVNGVAIHRHNS
jgi:N4-gp56 family major capsid protein